MDTHAQCRSEGMAFLAMVMQGNGDRWGTEAAKFWSKLAKSYALSSGDFRANVLSQFLGSLSILAHRSYIHIFPYNICAIIRVMF